MRLCGPFVQNCSQELEGLTGAAPQLEDALSVNALFLQVPGEVDGAFPDLESALINTRNEVGGSTFSTVEQFFVTFQVNFNLVSTEVDQT